MIVGLLLMIGVVIGGCSSINKWNTNLEENENLISPKIDPWHVFNKSKGRSTLKNLILSFQKLDSRKKMSSYNKKSEIKIPLTQPTSTEKIKNAQTLIRQIKRDDQDKANDKDPTYSLIGVDYSKLFPQHLELKPENKDRFTHSIVDGWTF